MKSVYKGGEKVAEFESYDELRLGENKPAFIYEGNELVYPNPVKDGLVLWYDFSGMTNADGQRGIAEDLSGNGNHGTLQNFNYTAESGYDKNKLLFDGVDDAVMVANKAISESILNKEGLSFCFTTKSFRPDNSQYLFRSSHLNILKHYGLLDLNIRTTGGLKHHYSIGNIWLENEIQHWSVSAFEDHYIMYLNGEKVIDSTYSSEELLDLTKTPSLDDTLSVKGSYRGQLNSFQFYNRPLTPEEIGHNYAIEKERFGIE